MYLSKLYLEGYRSCLETEIEFHPNLSVLIGPNSSGKTNILKSILLLRNMVEEERRRAFRRQYESSGEVKIKYTFDLGGKSTSLNATIDIFTDENNEDVIIQSDQDWYAWDFTKSRKRINFPLWLFREFYSIKDNRRIFQDNLITNKYLLRAQKPFKINPAFENALTDIIINISEMRYYSASQFTNPSNCPVSFEIEKEGSSTRGIRLRGHSKFLYDLYESWKKDINYQQFFEIIGPSGIRLVDEINFKEIATSSIDYSVRSGGRVIKKNVEKILVVPQFKIGHNELTPNQLSEGTFKTITLLFYLITESSKILLIEEPEVCVHHGLLSSIIELIKVFSEDKQIIITTHSDFVLDEVNPENVFRVMNDPKKGTKAYNISKSMTKNELNALHKYLETEGNLGEYWRHGGLES